MRQDNEGHLPGFLQAPVAVQQIEDEVAVAKAWHTDFR
jgi:hypothetical protein